MSDIKISDLTPVSVTEGDEYGDMYVPCVQVSNETETPYKYNLGSLIDSLNNTYNSVIGNDEIPIFNQNTDYFPGDFVRYYDSNTKKTEVWKFKEKHKGTWNSDDATKTSIYNELKNISSGENETVHCLVYRKYSNGTTTPIPTGTLYVEYNGINATINITDGEANFTLPFGTIYKVYLQQNITGFSTPPSYNNLVSTVYNRYLNFEYIENQTGKTSVTIELIPPTGIPSANFADTNVMVLENNPNSNSSSYIGYLDSNLTTTISDISVGKAYKVCWSYNNIYAIRNHFFIAETTNPTIEVKAHKIVKETQANANNLFIVTDDFFEISIEEFLDKKESGESILDNNETEIDDNSWKYIHVYSGMDYNDTFVDLSSYGCDYYVKLEDLFRQSGYTTKTWLSYTYSLDNVGSNSDDGKRNSYFMVYNAKELYINSYAAQWANSQQCTYSLDNNEIIMRGFIGSRKQLSILVNSANASDLYNIANILHINNFSQYRITPDSILSSDSNAYYVRTIWTSNQTSNSANSYAWIFASRAITAASKTTSYTVIPFYSPY